MEGSLAELISVRIEGSTPWGGDDLLRLGGLRAYVCEPKGELFDGDCTRRVGWVFIEPVLQSGVLALNLIGLRLKSELKGGSSIDDVVPWRGTGYFSELMHEPYFTYTIDNPGKGTQAYDKFAVIAGDTWPGHFEHVEPTGRLVRGDVTLTQMGPLGELPQPLKGVPLHLNEHLPLDLIGNWGRRIFESKKLWQRDASHTHVLIDIISHRFRYCDDRTARETAASMREEIDYAVLYRASLDRLPVQVFKVD